MEDIEHIVSYTHKNAPKAYDMYPESWTHVMN